MIWRYLAAWFVMLVIAVANGALRDFTYGKRISELAGHQLSTVIGSLLLGIVIWGFVRLYPPSSGHEAISIGLFWMALTMAFEFLVFHYVGDHSWTELLGNYNILKGRIWIVLLLWIAVAPYVFYSLNRRV
jgi:hypothetical protein